MRILSLQSGLGITQTQKLYSKNEILCAFPLDLWLGCKLGRIKTQTGACAMVLPGKCLQYKPDNLSSVSRTHRKWEGEPTPELPSDFHAYAPNTQTCKYTMIIVIRFELVCLSLLFLCLRTSTRFSMKRWRTSIHQLQTRQSSSEPREPTGTPVMWASLPSFSCCNRESCGYPAAQTVQSQP